MPINLTNGGSLEVSWGSAIKAVSMIVVAAIYIGGVEYRLQAMAEQIDGAKAERAKAFERMQSRIDGQFGALQKEIGRTRDELKQIRRMMYRLTPAEQDAGLQPGSFTPQEDEAGDDPAD